MNVGCCYEGTSAQVALDNTEPASSSSLSSVTDPGGEKEAAGATSATDRDGGDGTAGEDRLGAGVSEFQLETSRGRLFLVVSFQKTQ